MFIAALFINSPTLETPQMFFNGWMVKQTAVPLYHEILCSNKKRTNYCPLNNLNGSAKIIKSEKSQCQKITYYMVPFMLSYLGWQNCWNGEQRSDCQGFSREWRQEGGGGGYKRATGGILAVAEILCILTVSMCVSIPICYYTEVLQDVTFGGEWAQDTWVISVLFLIAACGSTIISKEKG